MSERTFFFGLMIAWLVVAAGIFISLFFVIAPYGRHQRRGWGATIPSRLGWIVMEAPAALTIAVCVWLSPPTSHAAWLLFALWEFHYLNRTIVFPLRMRGADQKPMPIMIPLSAIFFNVVNGYLNGRSLTLFGPQYDAAWLVDPRFLGGVALFALGWAINFHADNVLFKLRKPGETGYKIPYGGLYSLISCPNYFGEILEWTGFAIASWSLAGLCFAVWTTANLAPRAFQHHRWYKEKFPDYPARRRALLPFLA